MLPLFENSNCPGDVRSSKLPLGIAVVIPINGASEGSERSRDPFDGCILWSPPSLELYRDAARPSSTVIRGRLDESTRLPDDSRSVARVVRLSLAVKLEAARPESLRMSSYNRERAIPAGNRASEALVGLRSLVVMSRGDVDEEGAMETGIGGRATTVFS